MVQGVLFLLPDNEEKEHGAGGTKDGLEASNASCTQVGAETRERENRRDKVLPEGRKWVLSFRAHQLQ